MGWKKPVKREQPVLEAYYACECGHIRLYGVGKPEITDSRYIRKVTDRYKPLIKCSCCGRNTRHEFMFTVPAKRGRR